MKDQVEDLMKILFRKRKVLFLLFCLLFLLNLFIFLGPSSRRKRDYVQPNYDVITDNVKAVATTTTTKLYPDWVVANLSRDSPLTRIHPQHYDPNSAWTALDGTRPRGLVWPQPQNQQNVKNKLVGLKLGLLEFIYNPESLKCDVVDSAIERYKNIIADEFSSPDRPLISKATDLFEVEIVVTGKECEKLPHLDMDESYRIVANPERIYIEAKSVWGMIRGLETFSQLIWRTSRGEIVLYETTIVDYPRFKHRGLLIDTARHFLPKDVILKNLDAMSYNKMNVLHWHMVDDQSFSYFNKDFPELAYMGSYHPFKFVYTPDDVREIVGYASLRGIRVIPEFDTPGHTLAWGRSHPDLLTPCNSNSHPPNWGPFNPTREATYEFMEQFLTSVKGDFPDNCIHIGGDEVDHSCWSTNREIQRYMYKHKIDFTEDLVNVYMSRMFEIADKLNFRPIVWHEAFKLGLQGFKNAIVQVWDQVAPETTLHRMTSEGRDVIVSYPWYLDHVRYGESWAKMYSFEPLSFNPMEDEEISSRVLGGEACMWGEYFDKSNFLQGVWPRTSAVAERLWSNKNVNNVQQASGRLYKQRCRMIRRGIPAHPTRTGVCRDL